VLECLSAWVLECLSAAPLCTKLSLCTVRPPVRSPPPPLPASFFLPVLSLLLFLPCVFDVLVRLSPPPFPSLASHRF
jgi:hypothetical protein